MINVQYIQLLRSNGMESITTTKNLLKASEKSKLYPDISCKMNTSLVKILNSSEIGEIPGHLSQKVVPKSGQNKGISHTMNNE